MSVAIKVRGIVADWDEDAHLMAKPMPSFLAAANVGVQARLSDNGSLIDYHSAPLNGVTCWRSYEAGLLASFNGWQEAHRTRADGDYEAHSFWLGYLRMRVSCVY